MSVDDEVALEDALEPSGREVGSFGLGPDAHAGASFAFVFRHRLHERDEPAADLGVGDAHEGLRQRHAYRRCSGTN
jgi:hypothetical protein